MDLPPFLTRTPQVDPDAYIAPGATLIGDVVLGARSSVWYRAVLRADIERIEIGCGTNLQDGVIVHLASDLGVQVGDHVTVGHGAILHACRLANEILVGMGSIVMDGAEVGEGSIIGAGTLITKGQQIPPRSVVMGRPGKVVRETSEAEVNGIQKSAEKYIHVARFHREHGAKATHGNS